MHALYAVVQNMMTKAGDTGKAFSTHSSKKSGMAPLSAMPEETAVTQMPARANVGLRPPTRAGYAHKRSKGIAWTRSLHLERT